MGVIEKIPSIIPGGELVVEVMKSRMARYTAATVAGAVIIPAICFLDGIHLPFGMSDDLNVSGGHGTVTAAYPLKLPQECTTAYEADIEGAYADYAKKINIGDFSFSSTWSDKEGFDGKMKARVCREESKPVVSFEGQNNCDEKLCVDVSKANYIAQVEMANPAEGPLHTLHNGFAMAIASNIDTNLHMIPKVEGKGISNDKRGRIQGIALLAASKTMAEECGDAVEDVIMPIEEKQLQKIVTQDANAYNPDLELNPDGSDVGITLPKHFDLKDQYDDKALIKAADMDGMDINGGNLKGSCELNPKLKKIEKELKEEAN